MTERNAYPRRDGRWEVRIYTGTKPDGKRKYRSFYGITKEEAEKKALRRYNEARSSEAITKMTVGELIREYINRKQPGIRQSTAANYRMKAEKHLIPALGDIGCRDITAADIYGFIETKRRSGLSERYIYDIAVLLKSAFRYANITYGMKNVMKGIVMPGHLKPEVAVLTPDEQNRLKAYLRLDPGLTSLGVLLSLYTGLRIGEVCALQWKDIDLGKRIMTVNKTVQRIQDSDGQAKTKLIITAPKSRSSVRRIPLPECVAAMLERHKGEPEDYVISGRARPIEPRTMQYRFAKLLINANLPSVHFHSLRHAFATNCVCVGFDVKTLSELMGHSSVELTLDHYMHSSMEKKRAYMDMLSA